MKMTCKVAVAVMVFLGVVTTAVMSVDALRIPVLNFLISHTDSSSIINFDEHANTQPSISDSLSDLMPEGYAEVYSEIIDGLPSCMYANSQGDVILFDMTPTEGKRAFDSEDATVVETVFLDYAAIYICEDSRLQLLWFDEENNITFNCTTEGLSEDDFFSICTNLANRYIDIGG